MCVCARPRAVLCVYFERDHSMAKVACSTKWWSLIGKAVWVQSQGPSGPRLAHTYHEATKREPSNQPHGSVTEDCMLPTA